MFSFGKKEDRKAAPKNKGEAEKFVEDALPVVEVKISPDGMWYHIVYADGERSITEPISRASTKEQVLGFIKHIYPRKHRLVLPNELLT